jgi:hypothetical protein
MATCKHYGGEIKEGWTWKVCPYCSAPVEGDEETASTLNTRQPESAESADDGVFAPVSLPPSAPPPQTVKNNIGETVCIIIFLTGFAFIHISFAVGIPLFGAACYLAAFISIVTGFILYPKNRAVKVFFWLFIAFTAVLVIIFIVYTVFMLIMCGQAMPGCIDEMQSCPG